MLGWLRRRGKKTEPRIWRQSYVIYTADAERPAWTQPFLEPDSKFAVRFDSREDDPSLFELLTMKEDVDSILTASHGAVQLSTAYPEDRTVFLEFARLAAELAVRERDVIVNISAWRGDRAGEWLERLREFELTDHTTVHDVFSEPESPHWLHSHGFVQFGLPELEIKEVAPELADAAAALINGFGEWMLAGEQLGDGHTLESPENPDLWAICESIRADDNEGHGEPLYPLLRLSDFDTASGQKGVGLNLFLGAHAG